MPSERGLLLAGVTLADGAVVDVHLQDGRVAAVVPRADVAAAAGASPGSTGPAERLELDGFLLLPAPAEPHAHLDKALTAARVPNPQGDLDGAIVAWRRYRPSITRDDVLQRATRAALLQLANGATAIRSHVDLGTDIGLRSVDALLEVKAALADQLTLQVVALPSLPLSGAAGAEHRALLRAAMERGADVVGGCPHLDPDPAGCHEFCLEVAEAFRRPIDLHTDETINPEALHLPHFAELVAKRGFPYGATASHCVSLGVQPPEVAERVAGQLAAAGVSIVCLPQTNLFLQGRTLASPPRGLTALRTLLAAGVTVAAGGDNLQDPFNLVGRGDPLEAASLLVAVGHLTPEQAYAAVSAGARAAMGLPEARIEVGAPAELLAIRAASLGEAVATASSERVVVHDGRMVSRTVVTREYPANRAGGRPGTERDAPPLPAAAMPG